jgi:hypothetical protein
MPKTLEDGMVVTVEIGFSTTAGEGTVPINSTLASITWTDVTQYVRELSTSRGRSNELDTYSAGSCQVILDNRTRLFDPENTAGTYYGNLTPLRPIRIRVTPNGGTIRSIFFGFIDQWPQAYNYPNDATVAVTATDAFKILNEFKLPSYWNTTITNDAPTAWYRLSDFAGSPNGFEVVKWNAFSGQWRGVTTTFSTCTPSESLLVDDPAKSSAFDGNKWFQAWDVLGTEAALGGIPQTDEWTVQMWITTTAADNGNYAIFNHGNFIHGGTIGMVVDVQGRGFITAQFGNRGSSNSMVAKGSGLVVNDGKPHHIAIAYRSNPSFGNTFNLYVDGQLATSESSYYDLIETNYQSLSLGYPIAKSSTVESNFDRYFIGSIQDFVVWTSLLDGTTILKHYQTGAGTYLQGTRTDERITLLSNLAGWMSDGLDLNTGDSTVLGVQTTGKGLLDALKEVETAEQGRLFMSVDGKIRFIDRNAEGAGNFITSQATFSDNPGVGEIKYSDITLTYDDRYIYNEVTVTQPNGTTYTASDTTSQGKYFKRTLNIDNFIADTGYFVANTALYRLQQYKNPQMRIDELTVNARRAVAYQSPCVTLDIGDRITVERTPQDVGAQISKTLIIEGIKHSITRDNWVVTFTTSPTLENAPFVLDSATLGVLDTDLLGY